MHCSLLKNWITFRGRGWEQHSSRDYKGNSGELLDSCAWNYTGLITTTWAQTGCSAYQLIKHIQDKTPLTVLASLEHLPKNHDKASPQECRFNKNLCPLSSTKWTVCSPGSGQHRLWDHCLTIELYKRSQWSHQNCRKAKAYNLPTGNQISVRFGFPSNSSP